MLSLDPHQNLNKDTSHTDFQPAAQLLAHTNWFAFTILTLTLQFCPHTLVVELLDPIGSFQLKADTSLCNNLVQNNI